MKILITGCAGFIGFHLSKKLLEKQFYVIGVDNLNDYYQKSLKLERLSILKQFNEFKFFELDINDMNTINDKKIDLVINLAAQAGVRLPKNKHKEYLHSNVNGFSSVLDFISKNSIKKIIYASSSSVYSGLNILPLSEDLILNNPKSVYAQTKIKNEKLAKSFCNTNECKSVGLRFFTVYGPFGRPDMAYFSFANKIKNDETISLFNNGNTYRDMTYIDDIVNGIELSIDYINKKDFKSEIFNLGNDKPIKTTDLLNIIEKKLKKYGKIKYINKTNEVYKTHACTKKSKKLLGYEPKIDIECGMERFLNWFDG